MSHLKLYLDDERPCPKGWVLAKTVPKARTIIGSHMQIEGNTFEVSLDFDLGADDDMEHEKGVMLIFWFIDMQLWPEHVALHSGNPWGLKAMDWALIDMHKARQAQHA